MIGILEKQEIILSKYRDGETLREISRKTGFHRDTVKKYIEEYDKKRLEIMQIQNLKNLPELIEAIVEPPSYNTANRRKRKLSDKIQEKVKEYLEANKIKRKNGQRKQQLNKKDIHELLVSDGYDISYTTIVNLVNKLESRGAEAFIKQEYLPGEICEFDWGEVKIYIDGELRTYQEAVFTTARENCRFAVLFKKQDTQSFQQAHALFFEYLRGVPQTMVYDNMKVAVKKFVGISEKEPTEALLKLSLYYNFKFRFCNIRSGNEKGHVEKSVGHIRHKAFSKKDDFDSLKKANEYLLSVCIELNNKPRKEHSDKTPLEMINEAKEYLLPRLPMFECGEKTTQRVDKYSTVIVEQSHYSVSDRCVGKQVEVKKYADRIICYYQDEKVGEHEKKYGNHEWSIHLEHYTETLKRKPGALRNSVAMHQSNEKTKKIYQNYYIGREKEFIELIQYMKETNTNIEQVTEVINKIKKVSPNDISLDKIKTICERKVDDNINVTKSEIEIEESSKSQLIQAAALLPTDVALNDEVIQIL